MSRYTTPLLCLLTVNTLLVLNISLPETVLHISPDGFVVLGIAGIVSFAGAGMFRVIAASGAFILFICLFYKTGNLLYFRFFGREIILRHDALMIPNLVDLLEHTYSTGILITALFLFSGVCFLFVFLLYLLIRKSVILLNSPVAFILFILTGAAYFTFFAFHVHGREADANVYKAKSHIFDFAKQVMDFKKFVSEKDNIDNEIIERSFHLLTLPSDMRVIEGRDVYVFYVESYGRALWDDPNNLRLFSPFLSQWSDKLRSKGYSAASGFFTSPVKAGGSWFAHTTFITGFKVNNDLYLSALLESDLKPLPAYFTQRGYRTISVMPALKDFDSEEAYDKGPDKEKLWTERKFFSFSEDYWYHDFGYDGPRFNWSLIPDQYVLQVLKEKAIDNSGRPMYFDIVLTSSHSPFNSIPPYEDKADSARLLDVYKNTPAIEFDNDWHKLNEPAEGYTTALKYSLKSIFDFIINDIKRPGLFIILGDHQPFTLLPGTETYDVPVQILSRDESVTRAFIREGLSAGMFPDLEKPSVPMEDFTGIFFRALSRKQ